MDIIKEAHDSQILDIVLTDDSLYFITNGGRYLKVWNLAQRKCLGTIDLGSQYDLVTAIAILPDKSQFVTGSVSGVLKLYTMPIGKKSMTMASVPREYTKAKEAIPKFSFVQ